MKPSPLKIRKLADKSSGDRVRRFDPVTGNGYLTDPATWDLADRSTWLEVPWPLAGITVEGDAPKVTRVPASFVTKGMREGWLELEGYRVVHRPGGPPDDPWRVTHTFVQGDTLVLHTVDGDVRYRVVESPDKWPAEKNENDEGFGGEVRWFFDLKLEA